MSASLDSSRNPNALELRNITKSFGHTTALRDVSLTVRRHEVVGLIGENGAGKSTLLKILAGVHQQDDGELLVWGAPQRFRNPAQAAALGVGVVHQEQSLLTNWTVAENLHAAARAVETGKDRTDRLGLLNWRSMNEEAATALARVGVRTDPNMLVEHLSFAERQMVEIAKAVRMGDHDGGEPIIVLDEPTSILEGEEVDVLAAEMKRIKQLGSVIFVSHRLHEILAFTDRVYVLRAGQIVAERESRTAKEHELLELMTGREVKVGRREAPASGRDQIVLAVNRLTKHGEFTDVSFTVALGQVHCLMGTHSSGREALARALFGAESYDSGSITLEGRPFAADSVGKAIAAGVAYLPAERKTEAMIPGMSIAENMTLTHPAGSRRNGVVNPQARKAVVREWIKRLDVRPPEPDMDIARLSGGNAQKVVLGKWLCAEQLRLMILDHPLRGLDPGAIETIKNLIREECHRGTAVLLLADTLEEALEMSDEITVMRDGEVSGHYVLADGMPSVVDLLERMV